MFSWLNRLSSALHQPAPFTPPCFCEPLEHRTLLAAQYANFEAQTNGSPTQTMSFDEPSAVGISFSFSFTAANSSSLTVYAGDTQLYSLTRSSNANGGTTDVEDFHDGFSRGYYSPTISGTLPWNQQSMPFKVVVEGQESPETWWLNASGTEIQTRVAVAVQQHVYEGGTDPGVLHFQRSDTYHPLSIQFTVTSVGDNPAVEGLDFEPLPRSVSFSQGASDVYVPVYEVTDIKWEYPETFEVRIKDGQGYILSGYPETESVTMIVEDDDGGPTSDWPPEFWPPSPPGSSGGKNSGGGTDGPYGGGGGDDGNPNDTVTSILGGGGTSTGTTDGGDGETTGAFIPVNDDYDETNGESPSLPIPDNQANGGNPLAHRIVAGDNELRDWNISVNSDAANRSGTLTVTWNDGAKIKVWKPETGGTFTELSSGDSFPVNGAFSSTLKVEGIEASNNADDIQLASVFTPTSGRQVTATVKITAVAVDVDIDSDNTSPFGFPGRGESEDNIEQSETHPGKMIAVNNDDSDDDGIVDFADGYDRVAGTTADDETGAENFVPVVIEIPESIDLSVATFRIEYDASDPADVIVYGDGTNGNPYRFHLPNSNGVPTGRLRLWTQNGDVARSSTAFNSPSATEQGGYFIPPNETNEYYGPGDLSLLGLAGRRVTVWVEAVSTTPEAIHRQITWRVDPDGNANGNNFIVSDTVTVAGVGVLLTFQTADMTTARSVDPLHGDRAVGVVTDSGDPVNFGVNLLSVTPLPPMTYSWTGAATGSLATISHLFDSEGTSVQEISVLGVKRRITIKSRDVDAPGTAWFFANNAADALVAEDLGEEATAWANSVSNQIGGGIIGGRHDAARHAYWNLLMAVEMSVPRALAASNAYEYDNVDTHPQNHTVMDLENNRAGAAMSVGLSDTSRTNLQQLVLAYLDAGLLTVLDRTGTANDGLLRDSYWDTHIGD